MYFSILLSFLSLYCLFVENDFIRNLPYILLSKVVKNRRILMIGKSIKYISIPLFTVVAIFAVIMFWIFYDYHTDTDLTNESVQALSVADADSSWYSDTASVLYIYDKYDLLYLFTRDGSLFLNGKTIYIMNDIDMEGISLNAAPTVNGMIMYGQNHTISNFIINDDDPSNAGCYGFFGAMINSGISGLILDGTINVNMTTSSTSNIRPLVGGFAGVVNYGTFINCTSYMDINVTINENTTPQHVDVGGIVGNATYNFTATNCVNNGNISVTVNNATTSTSYASVGGAVGAFGGSTTGTYTKQLLHYVNNAPITVVMNNTAGSECQIFVGGMIGQFTGNDHVVAYCVNNAIIDTTIATNASAYFAVAGMVGYAGSSDSININNCYNSGNVIADTSGTATNGYVQIGGIVGWGVALTEVSHCVNTGALSSAITLSSNVRSCVGGIIGYTELSSIATVVSYCTNKGALNGTVNNVLNYSYIGGIVGCTNAGNTGYACNITNCSNVASITTSGYGVIGMSLVGAITIGNCFNYTTSTSAAFYNYNSTYSTVTISGNLYGYGQSSYTGGTSKTSSLFANWTSTTGVLQLLKTGDTEGLWSYNTGGSYPVIKYTVTFTKNLTDAGSFTSTISGVSATSGSYEMGTSLSGTATGDAKASFSSWRVTMDSTSSYTYTTNTFSDVVLGNAEYLAYFNPIYSYSFGVNDSTMGRINFSMSGANFTITAIPNENYKFAYFLFNGTPVYENPYNFTLSQDTTVIAYFEYITFNINVSSNDASIGSVSGGGTVNSGANHTITANPATGYHFVYWLIDGSRVETNPYIFENIKADHTAVAYFGIDTFEVTAVSSDPSMGEVSGGGTYNYGDTATLTAVASARYKFSYWLLDGEIYATEPVIQVPNIQSNYNFVAVFELNSFVVNISTHLSSDFYSLNLDEYYTRGDLVSLTITANDSRFRFVGWYDTNDHLLTSSNTYAFTIEKDTTLAPKFEFAYNTYEINHSSLLFWLAQRVAQGYDFAGVTFVLTSDIDMTSVSDSVWNEIGDAAHDFAGIFLGNGFVITGNSSEVLFYSAISGSVYNVRVVGMQAGVNILEGDIELYDYINERTPTISQDNMISMPR